MTLVEWRNEFNIGIPSVDHEHQELVELINALHNKVKALEPKTTVGEFFGQLASKISDHFEHEERLMREQSYFEYDAHKAEHEKLLEELAEIRDNYEIGAYLDFEGDLAKHLDDWFTIHFKTKDARLHAYLD